MNTMDPTALKQPMIWQLKANAILWLINGAVVLTLILMGNNFQALVTVMLFSKLAFLEAGITFLIGGVIAFSGSVSASKSKEFILKSSDHWSIEKLKASEKVANKYLFLAAIIFAVSIIISVLGY